MAGSKLGARRVRTCAVAAGAVVALAALAAPAGAQGAAAPDVTIAAATSSDAAVPGGTVTYTLTVTNAGSAVASDVRIVDVAPAPLSMRSVTAAAASCALSTTELGCAVTSIEPGASLSLEVVADVPPDAPNLVRLATAASVSAPGDTTPGNDKASLTFTVVGSLPADTLAAAPVLGATDTLPETGAPRDTAATAAVALAAAGGILLLLGRRFVH
jgi:uncharacterized repeat protein (TIGR01451 family)